MPGLVSTDFLDTYKNRIMKNKRPVMYFTYTGEVTYNEFIVIPCNQAVYYNPIGSDIILELATNKNIKVPKKLIIK